MVDRAFLRANIPFTIENNFVFSDAFCTSALKNGWHKSQIHGPFLLKHINTSLSKNVVSFTKKCENLSFTLLSGLPTRLGKEKDMHFLVDEINVYCFDTGVGIISFHIPYSRGTTEAELTNTCAALRCSTSVNDGTLLCGGNITCLSEVAQEHLVTLLGSSFTLFGQFNDTYSKRVDMFSAVLCDKQSRNFSYDKLCFLLANTFDNRDKKVSLDESAFYRQHEYTRWSFSKRGCAAVANLTGEESNDSFLKTRWFDSVRSNYFSVYLMVLHQKYAIYNYLNKVAEDNEKVLVELNQELLIEFNSKYIFSIVSDEHFIQRAYMHMRDADNVDEVYSDLLDELKRLFDYTRLKSSEAIETRNTRLNIISVAVSILCSISIVIDTINLFSSRGCALGFSSKGSILYTIILALEILIPALCLPFVFARAKKKQ